jgi:hypothetical protein
MLFARPGRRSTCDVSDLRTALVVTIPLPSFCEAEHSCRPTWLSASSAARTSLFCVVRRNPMIDKKDLEAGAQALQKEKTVYADRQT